MTKKSSKKYKKITAQDILNEIVKVREHIFKGNDNDALRTLDSLTCMFIVFVSGGGK